MIEIQGVTKRFADGTPALQDIDLSIPRGGVFGVVGRSGAGKSTLLRLINGLELPSEGEVRIDGAAPLSTLSQGALNALRRRIGMIFQSYGLLSGRTVAANVALPLELGGVPRVERQRRVAELLDRVGLTERTDAYPARLSGGQRQRVGIARALATGPDILLCDEPTSALDPDTSRSILDLLRELNRELGLTLVIVTHQMSVVRAVCRDVAVLDHGRLVEAGPVDVVFGASRTDATRRLLSESAP